MTDSIEYVFLKETMEEVIGNHTNEEKKAELEKKEKSR